MSQFNFKIATTLIVTNNNQNGQKQSHTRGNQKIFIIRIVTCNITAKKTKISEGYLVTENVKSLSNSVTKFCD